jgi:ribose transport system substrate-binding protein
MSIETRNIFETAQGLRRPKGIMRVVPKLTLAFALLVSTLGIVGTVGVASSANASTKTFTVYVSNNYMGNQWRPQMENDAKVMAKQMGGEINLKFANSAGTAADQIASLQTIIRDKPSAIMIDSASATALNPTIKSACAAGIIVFSFDQTVTAPCAYKLEENYAEEAHDMVMWLGTELKGKGNILEDTGLAGIPISTTFVNVWKADLAKSFPGIKIVGTFDSEYAPGPDLQGVTADLAQKVTVNGILNGGYCSSDIQALKTAGMPLVPDTCLDVNGNEQACQTANIPCFFFAAPAYVSAIALQDIVKILKHTGTVKKNQGYYNINFVTTVGNIKFSHQQSVMVLTPGVNYYPTESAALITPITAPGLGITAKSALNGPSQ